VLGNPGLGLRGTVVVEIVTVAPWHDLHAAVLLVCVGDGDPAREDRRAVGLGQQHAEVLMERNAGSQIASCALGAQHSRRRLHPHVLNRVRDELGPEDSLDDVEQAVVGEQVEDRRAHVKRGLGGDVLLGQADVEGLVKAPARLATQREEPLRERQAGMARRHGTLGDERLGDLAQDLVPLGRDRIEVRVRGEDVLDDDVAFFCKLRARVSGGQRHRSPFLASVPASVVGRSGLW